MKGTLCKTASSKWVMIYEFGQKQVKIIPVHPASLGYVEQNNLDGIEVEFEIRGMDAPRSFNGTLPSAKIILNNRDERGGY